MQYIERKEKTKGFPRIQGHSDTFKPAWPSSPSPALHPPHSSSSVPCHPSPSFHPPSARLCPTPFVHSTLLSWGPRGGIRGEHPCPLSSTHDATPSRGVESPMWHASRGSVGPSRLALPSPCDSRGLALSRGCSSWTSLTSPARGADHPSHGRRWWDAPLPGGVVPPSRVQGPCRHQLGSARQSQRGWHAG